MKYFEKPNEITKISMEYHKYYQEMKAFEKETIFIGNITNRMDDNFL
jgi:hypothetical protein